MSDLTTRVVNRHTNIAGALQIELVPDVRGGSVPVVAGQLLVPNEEAALGELDAALRGLKLGRGGTKAVAGGRLSLVTLPSLLPGKLGGVLGTLLRQGHRVRPNAVVAAGSGPFGGGAGTSGIVWKAHAVPAVSVPPADPYEDDPGGVPVQVTVIDTGIEAGGRTDHWLDGLQTPYNTDQLDVYPKAGYLDLAAGHGSFVAGIIRQQAPSAHLRVVRLLDTDGMTTDVDLADALRAEVHGGAGIVNLSCVCTTYDDQPPPALDAVLRELSAWLTAAGREIVVVAAGGNDGSSRRTFPAACADLDGITVLGVAALDHALAPAAFSSRGDWIDFSTVGVDVRSTYVTGTEDPGVDPGALLVPPVPTTFAGPDPWAVWSGTSFSAPQVAGRIAGLAQHTTGGGLSAAVTALRGHASGTQPDWGDLLASTLPK